MKVVELIRRGSPYGGFVKKNASGLWYEVVRSVCHRIKSLLYVMNVLILP